MNKKLYIFGKSYSTLNKILFTLIVIFLFTNQIFASNQGKINSYENKIEDYTEEINELDEYNMKYGIVKDIKYFEKLLEKYEWLEKKEKANLESLKTLEDCKNENETCSFGDLDTTITSEDLSTLINESSDIHHDYENKIEDLTESLEYLHKGEREIELKEKFEDPDNKFELEDSTEVSTEDYEIKNKKEENIDNQDKTTETTDENNISFKLNLEKKLDSLLEKYSKTQKLNIYINLLKKINTLEQNEKINILKEIIIEKIYLNF